MRIISIDDKSVRAIFQMEYKGYEISVSLLDPNKPETAVFEIGGNKILESFYGNDAIVDAMAFINRGLTKGD